MARTGTTARAVGRWLRKFLRDVIRADVAALRFLAGSILEWPLVFALAFVVVFCALAAH